MSFADLIEVNPCELGSTPVVRGTRIPVARLFDDLETGSSAEDFIAGCEIDPDLVRRFLRALSGHLTPPPP